MIAPPLLNKGDTISIIATAKAVSMEDVSVAKSRFEAWGLNVLLGSHILSKSNQFAGNDDERLSDLQEALDDPNIKAIIFARGGYGTTRLLDQVDFTKFKDKPKWLCGFSDITSLIARVNDLGYEALHAPMPIFFNLGLTDNSIQSLKKCLFDDEVTYNEQGHEHNIEGDGEGELIGGNLSMICNSFGTSSELMTYGKILFLEELTEYLYHIDRMFVHMDRAGKLENLSGLIIGHFSKIQDNEIPFGKTVEEIVLEHCGKYDYPISFGFPIGHEPENLSFICGRESELIVSKDNVILKQ